MTVGIVLNTGKTQAVPIALRMLGDIQATSARSSLNDRKSVRAVVEARSALLMGIDGGVPYEDVCQKADVLLVFGGDGTILGAVMQAAVKGVPIIGVNLGRVGFLTEMEGPSEGWVEALAEGRYTIDRRMMITAKVGDAERHALNDFVLSRHGAHILRYSVRVGGRLLGRYAADGVVVATPTGSTAYSLSAGGPIVSPKLQCMVVAPICPHTLRAHPVVVSPDEEIELSAVPDSGMVFSVDGEEWAVEVGKSIIINRSPLEASFIRFKERNFYALLSAKLSEWDTE